jgi:MFS family permease
LILSSREAGTSEDPQNNPRLFYGFIIAIAAFFVLFSSYGARFAYGVFFKPMAQQLHFSAATTSAAYSISFFIEGIFSLISGGLADRFGPRIVISISSLLVALGYFLMPLVHAQWQLYLFYGVIIGVGMGAMFVPLVSMTARWFNARRNLMTGLVSSGAGVGMLIVPSSTSHLIDSYGWRASFAVIGATILIVVFTAAQFMKRDPAKIGTVPYGESVQPLAAGTNSMRGHSLREALRIPQFWIVFVMIFWFGAFAMTYNVHIVPDAISSGMNPNSAAHILAVSGLLLVIGRIILGTAADTIGNKPIFILCFALSALALFFIAMVHTHWAFFVLAVVIGFSQGGIGTSQSPLVASMFGLKSHGLILGFIGFGYTIGAALSPYLAGVIFDRTGSYRIALLICALSSLAALVFASFLKPIKKSINTVSNRLL